jgi:hypothetical protein
MVQNKEVTVKVKGEIITGFYFFVVILDLFYSIFHLKYFSSRHNVSLKGLFV